MRIMWFWKRFGWLFLVGMFALGAMGYFQHFMPQKLKIPDGLSMSSDVESSDNFYLADEQRYAGERRSLSTMAYREIQKIDGNLLLQNSFTVRSLAGEEIFHVDREYGVDPVSGQMVNGLGDHDRAGYMFAPRMKGFAAQVPDRSSFTYWHANYNVPVFMEFREETTFFGIPVYRYESNFIADQTKEFTGVLPEVGATRGMSLDVNLQLWIDPVSGVLVNYQDNAIAYYYDLASGTRIAPWNHFSNHLATSSIGARINDALNRDGAIHFYAFYLPVGYVVLFFLALLVWASSLFPMLRKNMKRPGVVSVAIALSVSAIVFHVWRLQIHENDVRQRGMFDSATTRLTTSMQNRLDIYANILRSGVGLFDASNSVDRSEWKTYIDSLDLSQNYPGVQGIGYAPFIRQEDKVAFLAAVQTADLAAFALYPDGERSQYVPVLYLEPQDARNQRAIGFDMASEETRKAAIDYAMDSSDVSLSGQVTLIQENNTDVQRGFLMYSPQYKKNADISTIALREEYISGFVYAPFRAKDFIRSILLEQADSNVSIALYDVAEPSLISDDSLLYRDDAYSEDSPFQTTEAVTFFGRTWIIRFSSPGVALNPFVTKVIPFTLLSFGLVAACIFAYATYVTMTRKERAEAYSAAATKDLTVAKRNLETKVSELQRLNNVMVNRELKMVELKEELKKYRGDV